MRAVRFRDNWASALEGTDACAAGVLTFDEAPLHPHNRARGTFVGVGEAWHPAPAPRFSRSEANMPSAPRPLAEAAQVLIRLGVPSGDLEAWRAAGAFG